MALQNAYNRIKLNEKNCIETMRKYIKYNVNYCLNIFPEHDWQGDVLSIACWF
jgi:hypothetical protein